MVSQRGIEVSPDQVKAVMETPPPRSKKELQRLTGKLVALGRFIARFTDELRPFFLAIRKAGASGWTDSCQSAFEKIKHCLMQPPILSSPLPEEKLYMYLAVSEWAINAVLFRCPSPKEQKPIYYMELTALALRSAAQKLRPYFQAHPVVVLTDQPLRNILHKPDLTGRMLQWAIELSEYGIEFQPRLSMKGQVMVTLEYSKAYPSIRNQYEAILSGLDLALALSVSKLRVYSDSQLVVRHVQKEYEAKDARMALYLTKLPPSPSKKPYCCLYMCKPTLPSRKPPLAIPLRQTKQALCPKRPSRHIRSWAHSQGYYWPTMKKDVAAYVKKCDKCQRHAPIPHVPSETLKPISGPWPFAKWGMDIVGPLGAASQKKFLLVTTDYFSKWVEVEAYASIKDKDVTKFVWKNIICRFGIPQTIIADNGPHFDSIAFIIFVWNSTSEIHTPHRVILKVMGNRNPKRTQNTESPKKPQKPIPTPTHKKLAQQARSNRKTNTMRRRQK
ncbi:hypothetical protein AAG906_036835 [Vitis piasezkii]